MDERVSGFVVTGDWGEIVEHGERVTRALRDAGVEGDAVEQWDAWRPKSHELLGQDMREKTAQQASVSEGAGERAGKTAGEDLQSAGEELGEAYRKLESDDTEGAVEKWQDSLGYVARAADSAGRKAMRSVEDTVYKRLMTQVAPYYFDNELVSANIRSQRGHEDPFALEVNVNDDEIKATVAERLEGFEDDVKRWHVHAEKDTSVAEAAEGAEAPEPRADEADGRRT
ncbi:MAG: DUF5828 family protein [Halobacteriales archaeon]|nr:DUF5828 family protein [Halobacteriales archaeon]